MIKNDPTKQPIGVYDSGVGGLSVLRALHKELPHEDFIYIGDQAKVPYGSRSMQELRLLAEGITHFLLSNNAKMIVIACNTASAASLKSLRQKFPDLPIVGMEPAVKPAAEQTASGKVGVLATPSTFEGELYASVVERFAQGVEVYQSTCPGLVRQIEKGFLNTTKTRRILEDAILPMLEKGVDTLVMGCTHFPFVIPTINQITRGRARVIDPAPAVARQAARVLEQFDLLSHSNQNGQSTYFTTGQSQTMQIMLTKLIGVSAVVHTLRWQGEKLSLL